MAPGSGGKYVAMGSSFAAGPGITPVVDAAASRSGRNYAHQVAHTLDLELVDVTFSGATTADILTTPQRGRPPQIEAVTPDCELVTITAGGNDLGYVGTLFAAGALGSALRWLPLVPVSVRERLGDLVSFRTTPDAAPDVFAAVAASQAEVVERVRARAPRARILLVDYLTLIGAASVAPLTPAQAGSAAAVGRGLAQAFRDAAARSGAELVAASVASVSHGVGSPDPWVYGFELGIPGRGGPVPYHPNLTGMTEVAELVVETVRRPAPDRA
ncbi:SGNH/GDSL hydrolase family protein [Actinomycetospora endophytica]|uniref:SGNH/GDSL hydrolase family protein n=1 Tax=Actinomycetospora endophytica TaxID=2291215 RepID=A0ABS8P3M7_9PSEU|nr:SGNH/GDSL hydrolase family protein [Actinomycetospora endophytica]MCD2192011.1 SGNH/GDSL hydrolase family protein [Actinomycetospora endophytica]